MVGGLSLCATRTHAFRCRSQEYVHLGLSLGLKAPSGAMENIKGDTGGILPLSIDSESFELVKLLHEESSHQAFE